MTDTYSNLADVAERLIAKYGRAATIRVLNDDAEYIPMPGEETPDIEYTEYDVNVVFRSVKADRDGQATMEYNTSFLVAAKELPEDLAGVLSNNPSSVQIMDRNRIYTAVTLREVVPGDTAIYYDIGAKLGVGK